MEKTLRPAVQEFIRACDTFAGFAHQHNGLTEQEREVVMENFLRALERYIVPSPPPPEDPPLAATLSNTPLID